MRAQKLLVGFSDDRRFFVPVLILFVFFVLVIIIGGISSGIVLLPITVMRFQTCACHSHSRAEAVSHNAVCCICSRQLMAHRDVSL
jgi:uncharacterized membrane protein